MISPKHAILTINRACNNRCFGCYARETGYNKEEMSLETAKKLLLICSELKVEGVSLLGGEPTLYRNLDEIIVFSKNLGIKISMSSNGRKFSDFQFAKKTKENGLHSVGVSIKGYNNEDYLKAGGVDGYEEVVNGLMNLKELGIHTTISTVLFNENLNLLVEFLEKFSSKGFNSFSFATPIPVIENDKINDYGMLTPKESAECIVKLYPFLEKLNVKYKIMAMLPACLLTGLPIEKMYNEKKIIFRCSVPSGYTIHFGTKGEILPCNHIFNHPIGTMNKDYTNTTELLKLWNEGLAAKYRNTTQKYPSKKCIDCNLWEICGGGCLIRHMVSSPDEYIIGV